MKTHHMLAIATVVALSALAGPAAAANVGVGTKMQILDTNGDGKVTMAEYTAKPNMSPDDFDKIDSDHDGFITVKEMDASASIPQSARVQKAKMAPNKATAIPKNNPKAPNTPTAQDMPTTDAPMDHEMPTTTPPNDGN